MNDAASPYPVFSTNPNWTRACNDLAYRMFWMQAGEEIPDMSKQTYDDLCEPLKARIKMHESDETRGTVYTFRKK